MSTTTELTAPEIVCGGCANSIKKALGQVDGVSDVAVDVSAKTVTIHHDDGTSRETLVAALDRAGFTAA